MRDSAPHTAVNQWDPTSDLGTEGEGLADTLRLSSGTLMILDKSGLPLSRLWCLYEIAETERNKLELLTPGSDLTHVMDIFDTVDVASAKCFDKNNEDMIRNNIIQKKVSEDALTNELKALLGGLVMKLIRRQQAAAQDREMRHTPASQLEAWRRPGAGMAPGATRDNPLAEEG